MSLVKPRMPVATIGDSGKAAKKDKRDASDSPSPLSYETLNPYKKIYDSTISFSIPKTREGRITGT